MFLFAIKQCYLGETTNTFSAYEKNNAFIAVRSFGTERKCTMLIEQ